MALPPGVQAERQQQMAQLVIIERTRLQIASEIYSKIVSQEYVMAAAAAVHVAKKEADPFNTKGGDELDEALPEAIPFSVDINTAAGFAMNAATCLLCHAGMVNEEGRPIVSGPSPQPQEPAADKGIILGGN